MVGMIVAVSPEGVIGLHGKLPWHYPADLKRFKRLTMGATIIMGRLTYESIGKPLPGRRNLVVTRGAITGVECFSSLPSALAAATTEHSWLIGGAKIFDEGMTLADVLDVTYVPDSIQDPTAVKLPPIDPEIWTAGPATPLEEDPRLLNRVYRRSLQTSPS